MAQTTDPKGDRMEATLRDIADAYADATTTSAPNAWEATTADDLFAALATDGYTEGWE